MALADTPELIPYRVEQLEKRVESKADQSAFDVLRQDFKELRDSIRNWAIALMGSAAVLVAGVVAIVHPHS